MIIRAYRMQLRGVYGLAKWMQAHKIVTDIILAVMYIGFILEIINML